MTRRPYDSYVQDDLRAITARASTLYALSDPAVPLPLASPIVLEEFEAQAARELWEEGALHMDPIGPYYESATA